MIYRHLISCGYSDAATSMERECNIDLAKWDMADNIQMSYVLQEYEEYYELKFQNKPVLVKKVPGADVDARGRPTGAAGGVLPRAQPAKPKFAEERSGKGTPSAHRRDPTTGISRSNTASNQKPGMKKEPSLGAFEIQG